MRLIDRYLVRQTLGPFFLALGLFTFVVQIQPLLDQAETLLTKGVPLPTVGWLLVLLIPHALGITIPMAFLAGLLMALGRFSGDREAVALLACGVSPLRLLRPVLAMAIVAGGVTMYVLVETIPDANQRWREITYRYVERMVAEDIKPRIFYEGFPGKVIFVGDIDPAGGWHDVFIADTSRPGRPSVQVAERGFLVLKPEERRVDIALKGVTGYAPGATPGTYDVLVGGEQFLKINADAVFPSTGVSRGAMEMRLFELHEEIARKRAANISPHPEILAIHQRYSFPVACFVFGVLGLALGLHTRREGKLAGFTLGIAVVFVYYAVMAFFEGLTKGQRFPAEWARWMPNLALGVIAVAAMLMRTRWSGQGLQLKVPVWLRRRRGGAASAESAAAAAKPVILVIRIPEMGLPRPALLDLYVAGRYLRLAAVTFFGLMALYYVGTFIDLSEKLFKGLATGSMLAQYFFYSTPQFVYFVIPATTLVAVLSTIGALTRSSELTVMRACGISLYRTAVPLVLLAFVWSGALFLLEDRVLADSQRQAEVLLARIRDRPQRTFTVSNKNWLAGRDGRLYYYSLYDVGRKELHGLSVFQPALQPYRLRGHLFTDKASYRDGIWRAQGGWSQTFRDDGQPMGRRDAAVTLELAPPEEFGAEQLDAEWMNVGELREYISRLDESGFSIAAHKVELHRKIAFPFVTVVMTLVAIPFAVLTGRRGALYGVGLAIVLAVTYWLGTSFFLVAGNTGVLPPAVAAWAANALFLATAGYLILTVRT